MNALDCKNNPIEAMQFNGLITAKLLKASVTNRVKKFFFLSTAHVYSSFLYGFFDEESKCTNTHPYPASKIVAENYIKYINQTYEIDACILRVSNIIGPPMSVYSDVWHLVTNDFCKQAFDHDKLIIKTNGIQERDFITIYDFQRAIDHLINLEKISENNVFNLSSGKSKSIKKIASLVQNRAKALFGINLSVQVNKNDISSHDKVTLSNNKLKETGYKFLNNYQFAIDETLNFIKKKL